jgi:superfamily II DNA or RNA helicase
VTLRSHQLAMLRTAQSILEGAPIRRIYASVTPGGGKSALPGILADELLGSFADCILWVAPRDVLRAQGEADFPEWSRYRIRAASNESDPCRGSAGYITTYQAIVADPARHLKNLSDGNRWIIFEDEPHHKRMGSEWDAAFAPLEGIARLVVYASGTFSRGDGQMIAGLEYGPDGLPIFANEGDSAVIRYSRGDALREGAIVPVHFRHLDGRAEWEDEAGEVRSVDTLTGADYAGPALFTALRTGYALALLDEALAHWLEYRREVYPAGKLLVVAPDIKTAREYLEHLGRRGIHALIATSDDSPAAAQAIARFKGRALPSVDCLVTVAMAYEGMSVPAVSHIACLTHIRSIPWLEQCFARGNRTALGKREAFVFGPKDARLRAAIDSIEAEQVQALRDAATGQDSAPAGDSEGEGGGRPGIRPIESEAYREQNIPLFDAEIFQAPRPDGGLTPREAEKLLRKQIHEHIETVLCRKRPGSKAAYLRIIHSRLREIVGGRAREDCSVDELTAQLAWLKREMPL